MGTCHIIYITINSGSLWRQWFPGMLCWGVQDNVGTIFLNLLIFHRRSAVLLKSLNQWFDWLWLIHCFTLLTSHLSLFVNVGVLNRSAVVLRCFSACILFLGYILTSEWECTRLFSGFENVCWSCYMVKTLFLSLEIWPACDLLLLQWAFLEAHDFITACLDLSKGFLLTSLYSFLWDWNFSFNLRGQVLFQMFCCCLFIVCTCHTWHVFFVCLYSVHWLGWDLCWNCGCSQDRGLRATTCSRCTWDVHRIRGGGTEYGGGSSSRCSSSSSGSSRYASSRWFCWLRCRRWQVKLLKTCEMLSYSVNEACSILLHIQLITLFDSNMFFFVRLGITGYWCQWTFILKMKGKRLRIKVCM